MPTVPPPLGRPVCYVGGPTLADHSVRSGSRERPYAVAPAGASGAHLSAGRSENAELAHTAQGAGVARRSRADAAHAWLRIDRVRPSAPGRGALFVCLYVCLFVCLFVCLLQCICDGTRLLIFQQMVVESKVYIPSWAHGPLLRWITTLPSSRIDQPAALAELPISYATERTEPRRLILSDLIRS